MMTMLAPVKNRVDLKRLFEAEGTWERYPFLLMVDCDKQRAIEIISEHTTEQKAAGRRISVVEVEEVEGTTRLSQQAVDFRYLNLLEEKFRSAGFSTELTYPQSRPTLITCNCGVEAWGMLDSEVFGVVRVLGEPKVADSVVLRNGVPTTEMGLSWEVSSRTLEQVLEVADRLLSELLYAQGGSGPLVMCFYWKDRARKFKLFDQSQIRPVELPRVQGANDEAPEPEEVLSVSSEIVEEKEEEAKGGSSYDPALDKKWRKAISQYCNKYLEAQGARRSTDGSAFTKQKTRIFDLGMAMGFTKARITIAIEDCFVQKRREQEL